MLGTLALAATLAGCGQATAPTTESARNRCAGEQGVPGARGVSESAKTQLPDGTNVGVARPAAATGRTEVTLAISGDQARTERVQLGSTFSATGVGWRVSWICPAYIEVAPSMIAH